MDFDKWYDEQEKLLSRLSKKNAMQMAWHEGRSLLIEERIAKKATILFQNTVPKSPNTVPDELMAENMRLSKENTELKAGFQHLRDRQRKQAMATGARSKPRYGPVKTA